MSHIRLTKMPKQNQTLLPIPSLRLHKAKVNLFVKGQKIKAPYIETYLDGAKFENSKNYELTVGNGEVI